MDEQVRRHLELAASHLQQAVKVLRYLDTSEPGEDGETLSRLSPCARNGQTQRTDVQ